MGAEPLIGDLIRESAALGVDVSAARGLGGRVDDYSVALPALSDLADALAAASGANAARAAALRARVDELLYDLHNAERGPAADQTADFNTLPRAVYEDLRDGYVAAYASAKIRPERASLVAWHVGKLVAGQAAYQRVGARLGIPWYFVGVVHGLEASFRFDGHLHNGDPLARRTVQRPPGRPPVWNPPNDWDSSAIDALTFEGFAGKTDWSLPRMLYRWEAYNGFGYRAHGINSPYLWSFSTLYTQGKYAADGKWDSGLVSKQCGAAAMLKALVDGGHAVLAGA